jgi:SNF2 family DNA or RNA helicase
MEMGTGKTLCLLHFAVLRQHKIDRVFYFCPVSLKQTVAFEIEKHLEGATVYVFDDSTTQGKIPDAWIYVIGVESIGQSDRVTLAAHSLITEDSFVILDESDTCKNHKAVRTQRLTLMAAKARYRMIATGTAVGEGVVDLYAQLYFLSPDILGYKSFYSFAANHLEYSEDRPGLIVASHNTEYIAKRIEPYVYQCTKDECLDLPDKQYLSRYCSMTSAQSYWYRQAKEEILMSCPDDEINSYTIFRLFTALREIVSGFWHRLPDPNPNHWWSEQFESELIEIDCDRLYLLQATIREIPPSEKVILWANFQYCINQIVPALTEEYGEGAIATYHGQTEDKEAELTRWRRDARILVASPKCGGRGLTLNESAYTVFYNNDFPYRVRAQCEDRCHRIGQSRRPTYIDLICMDSLDQRIFNALSKKENLVAQFKRELDKLKGSKAKTKLNQL